MNLASLLLFAIFPKPDISLGPTALIIGLHLEIVLTWLPPVSSYYLAIIFWFSRRFPGEKSF